MTRYVYAFDETAPGGRELLGGKGLGLAEMTQLGIPVPAGFTITTDACRAYMAGGKKLPEGLEEEIDGHLRRLEERTGKRLGDAHDPLLVSVRSGAAVSMPGMMDTVLNLGMNDAAAEGMDSRVGWDSYRRLVQMYGEVVDGIDPHRFEEGDADPSDQAARFKRVYEQELGRPFPQEARAQLIRAVQAVFESWDTPRAQVYRRANGIPDDLGTAVNVVQMVFGNKGETSGTGVCFTRDPSTGEKRPFGEFLVDAQGEDVVAGIRTPEPLDRMRDRLPDAYEALVETMDRLERHYRDVQDIEFTVEDGILYLLQTRSAKRTAAAALKCAVDMVAEGLISREEAVARIDPAQLDQLLHPMIDPKADYEVAARGLNASPGAASGAMVLEADTAADRGAAGESVILVRWETTPDDIHGMIQAAGVLTAHGGMTSHAAVVARGMGKPCVAGCEDLSIDLGARTARIGSHDLSEGEVITINGATGEVVVGEVPLVPPRINEDFETVLEWADGVRRLRVRANADTPEDATRAREFGAEGIGLCRTEHMFFAEDRLPIVREMILAEDEAGRRSALERLRPMQQGDFEAIFEAMAGLPVTIRLLDPPLHEFLPERDDELKDLSVAMGVSFETLRRRREALREFNPMLGHRGCRLGVTYPEIYEVQIRAIAEAVVRVKKDGVDVIPEIMIPLVATSEELRRMRELTVKIVEEVFAAAGASPRPEYTVGTMIELPRACVRADTIAAYADFFSFGTNDLTQTGFGLSRDDAGKFLPAYVEMGVLPKDPFVALDQEGIGALMQIAIERAKKTKPDLKLGICGEHGGEPSSVEFCHTLGLSYVSCSPFRVPVARIAAAQAAIREKRGELQGVHSTA
ncbi:MAG TPA: pyruvate, phosphate dikinase [Gaiellaceae bacterium]|nr:pyruvate, phosphate dikinase [Gaiellaceae bacterium]